ncbi:stage V sporulation protein R [archaeon]|nr:stage V sporulation protein R [archaeon]|tara:strand:+ start:504 stop:1811 length:1308 start_codon:yes stop_codon:yes gene_type:complete
MNDWTLKDLSKYDDKICALAKTHGLDWYPIIYETCDYYEMIGNMAYHGMPTHYSHWSYGKSFERTHQMYNAGAEGLPYELIINSDPSISYLMRENPFYLQVLIMCHCIGHSDFFKNNRMFKNTRPNSVVARFRNAKKRIQSYIEDPSIGIEAVENILDAAHAVQFQVPSFPYERPSHEETREKYIKLVKNDGNGNYTDFDLEKIPLEADHDILGFIIEHGGHLDDWQIDLIEIARDESRYFLPQMQTKIMNEGWACFWHYKLMHELELPQELHIPFIKSHNQVVRPHIGGINPYHLGFHLFNKIEERYGLEECFIARECAHDEAFLRQYLIQEDCEDLNLFAFANKKGTYTIDEISDEEGWKLVKESLIKTVGINSVPKIYIDEIENGNILSLKHQHDGRDLDLNYADEVILHVGNLWKDVVKLTTVIEDEPWEI